ncbi:MAG: PAS domain-containing protein [Ectothiorhodospiraceae bacterium]|nr:PAS domain-containing protein [Ectothiorhodospiraceae bacterium]
MVSGDLLDEARLRLVAEGKLESGTAPPAAGWTVSADALGMLYRLASSPDTAGDALKLLHELQVHQVELGLQQGQLEVAEREASEALSRYRVLYEFAPVGYFVLDRAGVVIDVNHTGLRQLGGSSLEDLTGRAFGDVLTPESRPGMQDLFAALGGEGSGAACRVRFNPDGTPADLTVSVAPGGDLVFIVVSNGPGCRES